MTQELKKREEWDAKEVEEILKGTAIIRWTGLGKVRDLDSSIRRVLDEEGMKADVHRVGGSLLVDGAEPTSVATLFRHMPGVSWVAVGFPARSYEALGEAAKTLARRYLRRGDKFIVLAEATGYAVTSDVMGGVTSAVIGVVDGTRTDDQSPRVRFRAAFDGSHGAVGVQIAEGPGGVPTGSEEAVCLVSGGKHSSVTAWMAVLAGYRVSLVHSKTDDGGVRDVARLYSELSNRTDQSKLSLEVLEGGVKEIEQLARSKEGAVFGGFHAGCSKVPRLLLGLVEAPLFLLPELEFDRVFDGLGLKARRGSHGLTDGATGGTGRWRVEGTRGDVSNVIGGLQRVRLRRS
ncbi:MAG: hypothetical protein OK438_08095 [Thaumarchaeota archaeon]|nr:hypothetical protein [Nitrososphaerota archaeon]